MKTVYRLWLRDEMDPVDLAAYCSQMAEQGLFLKKTGNWFARFRRDTPQSLQYCAVVFPKAEPDAEQQEAFATAGWEPVCRVGDYHLYAADRTARPPEILPDLMQRGYRRLWRQNLIFVLLGLAALVFMGWWSTQSSAFWLKLIDGGIYSVAVVLLLLLGWLWSLVALVRISRKRRETALQRFESKPDDRKTINRTAIVWKAVVRLLVFVQICSLLASLAIVGLEQLHPEWARAQIEQAGLPCASLRETTEGAVFSREDITWLPSWLSPLTQVRYQIIESTEEPGGETLRMEFYTLQHGLPADVVCDALMEEWFVNEENRVTDARFDRLYRWADETFASLLVQDGQSVLFCWYIGDEDTDAFADRLLNEFDTYTHA